MIEEFQVQWIEGHFQARDDIGLGSGEISLVVLYDYSD